jgi:hypothetical protein
VLFFLLWGWERREAENLGKCLVKKKERKKTYI